jgi:hypothetical protein
MQVILFITVLRILIHALFGNTDGIFTACIGSDWRCNWLVGKKSISAKY